MRNERRIQSAAVNLAAERFGTGKTWLARIDAHCEYPPHFVNGLILTAEEKHASSVAVPLRTKGHSCFQRAVAAAQNSVLGTGGSAHRVGRTGRFVEHGHHALMDMITFKAAGGYCESMSHNEDAELDIRFAAAGGRIWLEPSLAVTYYPRSTAGSLFRQYLCYGRGRARTMLRHRKVPRVRQTLPLAVAPAILMGIAGVGFWSILALPLLLWSAACILWGAWLGFRSRSGCETLSGFAAMIMHAAWSLGFWRECVGRGLTNGSDPLQSRFVRHPRGLSG
jgi:succinoglycan biosynthesis protein ExoA